MRNLSHLTAKNCLCELIKIETLDDGSFKKAPLFDSPRLAWNFEWDNAPPDQRRDISPQGALFADVLFTYNNKGSQGVFLRALAFNRHFREFIRLNNSYRVTIRLSADNRKSQELCLKFVFSKTWDSFEVAVE